MTDHINIRASYDEVVDLYAELEKLEEDAGYKPRVAGARADAADREAELAGAAVGALERIAEIYREGTDSDGWDIGILEDVALVLEQAGFDIEIKNEPCVACGRDDLPLHVNYQCPECYTPEEEGND